MTSDDYYDSDVEEDMMAAIGHDIEDFSCASERLKDDKKFVLRVVSQNGLAFRHVSDRLQGDIDVVLAAISNMTDSDECIYAVLEDDKEIELALAESEKCGVKFCNIFQYSSPV